MKFNEFFDDILTVFIICTHHICFPVVLDSQQDDPLSFSASNSIWVFQFRFIGLPFGNPSLPHSKIFGNCLLYLLQSYSCFWSVKFSSYNEQDLFDLSSHPHSAFLLAPFWAFLLSLKSFNVRPYLLQLEFSSLS